MTRFGPLTLSLAEVALNVLFAVLLLLLLSAYSAQTARDQATRLGQENGALQGEKLALQEEVRSEKTRTARAEAEVQDIRDALQQQGLLSKIYPTCSDKSLFRIHVLPDGLYELEDGRVSRYVTLDALEARFGTKRRLALTKGTEDRGPKLPCMYRIDAVFARSLTAEQFNCALTDLSRLYRVRRIVADR